MIDVTAALVVHVLSVVWWIGGLAFVAAVFLPSMRAGQQGDALAAFRAIEHRFEPQARIAVVLTGLSGLYMLLRLDAWSLFAEARYWWLDLMALYWVLFMLMLFVLSPSGLLKRIMNGTVDEQHTWKRMHNIHRVLLVVGLVIITAGVVGRFF